MIANKKEFSLGLVLFVGFWGLFIVLMSPVFAGKNLLDYMDNLYNMISKKSSYYIPVVQKKLVDYTGQQVSFTLKAKGEEKIVRLTKMFQASGATVTPDGEKLEISGDLNAMINAALVDSEAMFHNDGKSIIAKYGSDERKVLYDWWDAFKTAEKEMNKNGKFKEGKIFNNAQTKAIEPAYNYYGIEAVPIKDKWGTVVLSLAGYVIYTLWFGFAILFMFEGWGMKLDH
ncbi:MAG: hypothetical protein Q8J76_12895 [Desulfobulbaceae bacterium]|nr:hypothetical protein [Desulfobulbaceae bacterium]